MTYIFCDHLPILKPWYRVFPSCHPTNSIKHRRNRIIII